MVIGMIIFMYSKTLGENALFFYLVGISSGICASFMILVYFISKLLPGVSLNEIFQHWKVKSF